MGWTQPYGFIYTWRLKYIKKIKGAADKNSAKKQYV